MIVQSLQDTFVNVQNALNMLDGHVHYLEHKWFTINFTRAQKRLPDGRQKRPLTGAPIPVFILLQYLNAHGFLTHNVGHYLGGKKNALELNKSLVCLPRLINESRSRCKTVWPGSAKLNPHSQATASCSLGLHWLFLSYSAPSQDTWSLGFLSAHHPLRWLLLPSWVII